MPDSGQACWVRDLLEPGERCIDVGCGMAPQNVVRYQQHVCIEPCPLSVHWLERRAFNVKPGRAQDLLPDMAPAFAVFMLDVLHCLELPDARNVLALAKRKAVFQLVVSVPEPIMNRHEQPANMWDRHRSVWTPDMLGPEPWQVLRTKGDAFIAVLSHAPLTRIGR